MAGKSNAEVLRTTVNNPDERRSQETPTQIVVKSGTEASVRREFGNYRMYEDLEGVRSVTPVGYVDHGDGTGHLYTLFEDNAIPLKNINFRSLGNGERLKLLRECARGIGLLHRQSVAHNDLKLKNILYTQDQPNDPLIFMDVAKSTRSRRELSHQASLYDLLAFIGDAHHEEMIRRPEELDAFIHHYLVHREPERYVQKTKTEQEEYRRGVKVLLSGKISEHESDVVIQNAAGLFKLPRLPRRKMSDASKKPPVPDVPVTEGTFKKLTRERKKRNGSS